MYVIQNKQVEVEVEVDCSLPKVTEVNCSLPKVTEVDCSNDQDQSREHYSDTDNYRDGNFWKTYNNTIIKRAVEVYTIKY